MNEELKSILIKHLPNFESDNFEGWKTTEIMYCKIGWVIDCIEDLEEHRDILLSIQSFIEDLQKLENK